MFRFGGSRLDNDAILHAGLQWRRGGSFNARVHAANVRAIRKFLGRHGIRIGHEFPNWVRIPVGLNFADGNDLDRCQ